MKLVASLNLVVPSKGSRDKELDIGDRQKKKKRKVRKESFPVSSATRSVHSFLIKQNPGSAIPASMGSGSPVAHTDHCRGMRWREGMHVLAALCQFLRWRVKM